MDGGSRSGASTRRVECFSGVYLQLWAGVRRTAEREGIMAYTLNDLEAAGLTVEQIKSVIEAQQKRLKARAQRRRAKILKRLGKKARA
jgi:hypothetical protein